MLDKLSKRLAYLLRHDVGKIDINGWRKVSDLVLQGFTEQQLEKIVETDAKKRYEFDKDHKNIRAVQGHSIPVIVDLKELQPPDILYHGTSSRFLPSIFEKGIIKGSRNYVHLSDNKTTAEAVGKRHGGQVIVLSIDAKNMYLDGYKFFISKNGVWLTDFVPYDYII